MPYIVFQKKRIFYKESGQGRPIILLHGFTESQKIWKHFAKELSNEFRVITIDLPGHGKSESVAEVHTMELQAEVVHAVLKKAGIKRCIMIGHSMGGYVTLAFAGQFPQVLKGFGLIHSQPFADTAENKETRDRTIQLVKRDKLSFITRFIPELFPTESVGKYQKDIDKLISRAGRMSKEGIIGALGGMKVRTDKTEILKNARVPVLFVIGMKDTKIPVERSWEMISLPAHSESLILRDVGHMGYIESPKETLNAIRQFVRKL